MGTREATLDEKIRFWVCDPMGGGDAGLKEISKAIQGLSKKRILALLEHFPAEAAGLAGQRAKRMTAFLKRRAGVV